MWQTGLEDADTRRQRIAQALDQSAQNHWVRLRQGPLQLKAAPIDQELLLYRVDNGRLLGELTERLSQGAESISDLRRQESQARTQTLLHQLLVAKASDPQGPILQELERLGAQTEPLLISADGIVINGNRRLAAMRELLRRDPNRYRTFLRPLAAVLPADAKRADLEFAEASLQMAPETKLNYGWIERRLKLREHSSNQDQGERWILEAYRINDIRQIQTELAELELAEAFLRYVNKAHQYSSISDCEELFKGLRQQLNSLSRKQAKAWRLIGFALISNRRQMDSSQRLQFPFSEPGHKAMPGLALTRLADTLTPAPRGQHSLSTQPDSQPGQPLLKALRHGLRREDQQQLTDLLLEAIDHAKIIARAGSAPQKLLHSLRHCRKLIHRLNPQAISRAERNALRAELKALSIQAKILTSRPSSAISAQAHQSSPSTNPSSRESKPRPRSNRRHPSAARGSNPLDKFLGKLQQVLKARPRFKARRRR